MDLKELYELKEGYKQAKRTATKSYKYKLDDFIIRVDSQIEAIVGKKYESEYSKENKQRVSIDNISRRLNK